MKLKTLNTAITIDSAQTETTDGKATRESVILLTTDTDTEGKQSITAVLDLKQAQQLADYLNKLIAETRK